MENKELNSLVIEEATNLKKFATEEELKKLNFENIKANSSSKCIYGQLTGNCFSDRADELILKCCHKMFVTEIKGDILNTLLKDKPNKLDRFHVYAGYLQDLQYFSPIEKFLYLNTNKDNIERLVKFLKSEVETLELN